MKLHGIGTVYNRGDPEFRALRNIALDLLGARLQSTLVSVFSCFRSTLTLDK